MQTLGKDFRFADSNEHSWIFSMLPVPLANVPFHNNTEAIKRFFPEGFPVHLAVHEVSPVADPPAEYTMPHIHEYWDEINLIISQHDLLYRIQLGDEKFTVSNNSCIWIPRGITHVTNLLKGTGYFITIRLD